MPSCRQHCVCMCVLNSTVVSMRTLYIMYNDQICLHASTRQTNRLCNWFRHRRICGRVNCKPLLRGYIQTQRRWNGGCEGQLMVRFVRGECESEHHCNEVINHKRNLLMGSAHSAHAAELNVNILRTRAHFSSYIVNYGIAAHQLILFRARFRQIELRWRSVHKHTCADAMH